MIRDPEMSPIMQYVSAFLRHSVRYGMYNKTLSDASLIACPHCDLLQRLPNLAPGESARCPRCDEELWRRHAHSLDRPLALTLAAVEQMSRILRDQGKYWRAAIARYQCEILHPLIVGISSGWRVFRGRRCYHVSCEILATRVPRRT